MRLHFRRVKDFAAPVLNLIFRALNLLPEPVFKFFAALIGLLGKAYYFAPGSHVRKAAGNFCKLTGQHTPRELYFQAIDNLVTVTLNIGRLVKNGPEAVVDAIDFQGADLARCTKAQNDHGCGIFVVPHCAGSILASVRFFQETVGDLKEG